MRMCVACRQMQPKKALLRVVRTPEGDVIVDATGRKNGRGAYLCRSMDCFRKAVKIRALERALEHPLPSETREALEKEFEHACLDS